MKEIRYVVFSFLLIFIGRHNFASAQKPSLKFKMDSITIGHGIETSLSFRHASDQEVFFPDKQFDFHPFELLDMEYFTTDTKDSISLDSVKYILKSFDITKVQKLKLPVWVLSGGDSIRLFSNTDSVILKELIPDSLLTQGRLKKMESMIPMKKEINYPLIIKWLIGFLLIFSLVYFVFGNTIISQLKLIGFNRRQKNFNVRFKKLMRGEFSTENLTNAVVLWKNQMEFLDSKPYTSMSSSEIMDLSDNENIGNALKELDQAVYGGMSDLNLPLALQILYAGANDIFRKKRRTLYKRLKNR